MIRAARERDIPVGPGRGSAAGSLVSYCIGITNSDAINRALMDYSQVLEGLARHASTHAAGVVITPDEMTNYTDGRAAPPPKSLSAICA